LFISTLKKEILCINFDTALRSIEETIIFNFHIHTVHLDIIKVFHSPTNSQGIVLKTVLKFTSK